MFIDIICNWCFINFLRLISFNSQRLSINFNKSISKDNWKVPSTKLTIYNPLYLLFRVAIIVKNMEMIPAHLSQLKIIVFRESLIKLLSVIIMVVERTMFVVEKELRECYKNREFDREGSEKTETNV